MSMIHPLDSSCGQERTSDYWNGKETDGDVLDYFPFDESETGRDSSWKRVLQSISQRKSKISAIYIDWPNEANSAEPFVSDEYTCRVQLIDTENEWADPVFHELDAQGTAALFSCDDVTLPLFYSRPDGTPDRFDNSNGKSLVDRITRQRFGQISTFTHSSSSSSITTTVTDFTSSHVFGSFPNDDGSHREYSILAEDPNSMMAIGRSCHQRSRKTFARLENGLSVMDADAANEAVTIHEISSATQNPPTLIRPSGIFSSLSSSSSSSLPLNNPNETNEDIKRDFIPVETLLPVATILDEHPNAHDTLHPRSYLNSSYSSLPPRYFHTGHHLNQNGEGIVQNSPPSFFSSFPPVQSSLSSSSSSLPSAVLSPVFHFSDEQILEFSRNHEEYRRHLPILAEDTAAAENLYDLFHQNTPNTTTTHASAATVAVENGSSSDFTLPSLSSNSIDGNQEEKIRRAGHEENKSLFLAKSSSVDTSEEIAAASCLSSLSHDLPPAREETNLSDSHVHGFVVPLPRLPRQSFASEAERAIFLSRNEKRRSDEFSDKPTHVETIEAVRSNKRKEKDGENESLATHPNKRQRRGTNNDAEVRRENLDVCDDGGGSSEELERSSDTALSLPHHLSTTHYEDAHDPGISNGYSSSNVDIDSTLDDPLMDFTQEDAMDGGSVVTYLLPSPSSSGMTECSPQVSRNTTQNKPKKTGVNSMRIETGSVAACDMQKQVRDNRRAASQNALLESVSDGQDARVIHVTPIQQRSRSTPKDVPTHRRERTAMVAQREEPDALDPMTTTTTTTTTTTMTTDIYQFESAESGADRRVKVLENALFSLLWPKLGNTNYTKGPLAMNVAETWEVLEASSNPRIRHLVKSTTPDAIETAVMEDECGALIEMVSEITRVGAFIKRFYGANKERSDGNAPRTIAPKKSMIHASPSLPQLPASVPPRFANPISSRFMLAAARPKISDLDHRDIDISMPDLYSPAETSSSSMTGNVISDDFMASSSSHHLFAEDHVILGGNRNDGNEYDKPFEENMSSVFSEDYPSNHSSLLSPLGNFATERHPLSPP